MKSVAKKSSSRRTNDCKVCASGVVYANYKSAIDTYEGGAHIRTVPGFGSLTPTGGIFCTYPQAFLSKTGQFFSEFIASSILMFVIYAINDNGNMGATNLGPLMLLFLIYGLGTAFGWETGYAINPARDFGPRLMSYCLGYGTEVWRAGNYYFWVSSPCSLKARPPFLTNLRHRSPSSLLCAAAPLAAGSTTPCSSPACRP